MTNILESLQAFYINGINHILLAITTNWWFIAIVLGAAITSIMGWRESKANIVLEEQNIL